MTFEFPGSENGFSDSFPAGGSHGSSVLHLGFDDQIIGDDDNHDGMIIRMTAKDFGGQGVVPEPASVAA